MVEIIQQMNDRSSKRSAELTKITEELLKGENADETDQFFKLMSKKSKSLGKKAQEWMEDQIWEVWKRAREMDEESKVVMSVTEERNLFDFMGMLEN